MNHHNEESRNRFFQELSLRLREAEIQTGQATIYHLPILYDGCQICEVNLAGMVTRHSTYPKSQEGTAIYQRTIPIASQVREYMTAMDTARPLLAEGLDPRDGYRLLAEFNGCVLAGRYSEYGCQFVTWEWDDEHKHLVDGCYVGGLYQRAKEDFATRSQLVNEDQIFQPGQMETLYKALNWYMEEYPDLTCKEAREIEALQKQMEQVVPDLEEPALPQGLKMQMQ